MVGHTHEAIPQEVTGETGHETENGIQGDAGTPASGGKGIGQGKRAQNIGGNEIEDGTRGGRAQGSRRIDPFLVGDSRTLLPVGGVELNALDVSRNRSLEIGDEIGQGVLASPGSWWLGVLLLSSHASIVLILLKGDVGVMEQAQARRDGSRETGIAVLLLHGHRLHGVFLIHFVLSPEGDLFCLGWKTERPVAGPPVGLYRQGEERRGEAIALPSHGFAFSELFFTKVLLSTEYGVL